MARRRVGKWNTSVELAVRGASVVRRSRVLSLAVLLQVVLLLSVGVAVVSAEDGGVIWQDPRRDPACHASQPMQPMQRKGAGDTGEEGNLNLYHPFGLDFVTMEQAQGGEEWCLSSKAQFATWHFYSNQRGKGRFVFVRNLKAGTTSTLKWIDGRKIFMLRTGGKAEDDWPRMFAPLRFMVVRHPVTRFVSGLGTIHRLMHQRHIPLMPRDARAAEGFDEEEWLLDGGFGHAVLDVLEDMGRTPTRADDFHMGLRAHPLILHHAFSQSWFAFAPPCPVPKHRELAHRFFTEETVDLDAVLRVEQLVQHSNVLRRHPRWSEVLPNVDAPWVHRGDGRGGAIADSRRITPARTHKKSSYAYRAQREADYAAQRTARTDRLERERQVVWQNRGAPGSARQRHHDLNRALRAKELLPGQKRVPCNLVRRIWQYYSTDFACFNYSAPTACIGSNPAEYLVLSETDI